MLWRLHPYGRRVQLGPPCAALRLLAQPLSALPRLPPMQLLQRCGWRVLLRDMDEVRGAVHELSSHPTFPELCQFVSECVRTSAAPLGTHGHSPEAAAAAAAQQAAAQAARRQQRSAGSRASVQTCDGGSRLTVGSVQARCGPATADDRTNARREWRV